jgi:hypothetical protein
MRNGCIAAVSIVCWCLPALPQCANWSPRLDQLLGSAPDPMLAQPLADTKRIGIGQMVNTNGAAAMLQSGNSQMSAYSKSLSQYQALGPSLTERERQATTGAVQWGMDVQAETNRLVSCFAAAGQPGAVSETFLGAGGRAGAPASALPAALPGAPGALAAGPSGLGGMLGAMPSGFTGGPLTGAQFQAQMMQWQNQLTNRAREQQLMAQRERTAQTIMNIQERMTAIVTKGYEYRLAAGMIVDEKRTELENLRDTPALSETGAQLFAAAGANRASNLALTTNRATMSTANRQASEAEQPANGAAAKPQSQAALAAPPLTGRPCKASVEYLGPALVTDRVRGAIQHLLLIQEPDNSTAERVIEIRFAWTTVEPGGKIAEVKEDRVRASVLKDSDRGIAVIGFVLGEGARGIASGVAVKEVACVVK